jgi:hypothetical protein
MASPFRSLRHPATEPRLGPAAEPRRASSGGSRRPGLALLGFGIVLTCAAIGTQLTRGKDHLSSFLALVRPLAAGQSLRTSDLTVVQLSPGAGFAGLPATEATLVTGKRLSTTLPAGSLLLAADLNVRTPPPRDGALVGTNLGPQNLPEGLEPGDRVLLVRSGNQTDSSSATSASPSSAGPTSASSSSASSSSAGPGSASPGSAPASPVLGTGTVFSVSVPGTGAGSAQVDSSGSTTVTIAVPPAIAAQVATASALGDISLVELPAASRGAGR